MKTNVDFDVETKQELGAVELGVIANVSLADLIRAGCKDTEQSVGWGDGVISACALTSAGIAAKKLGYQF